MKDALRLLAIVVLSVGCATPRHTERCTRLVTIPPEGALPETRSLLAAAPVDSPCVIVEQHRDDPQFALWIEATESNEGTGRVVVRSNGLDGQPRTYARDIDASDYRMVVHMTCTTLFSVAESHRDTKCHKMRYLLRRLEPPRENAPTFGFARMYSPTSPLREVESLIQSLTAYVTAPEELALVKYLHFRRTLSELDRVLHRPECEAGAPLHHGKDGQLTCK